MCIVQEDDPRNKTHATNQEVQPLKQSENADKNENHHKPQIKKFKKNDDAELSDDDEEEEEDEDEYETDEDMVDGDKTGHNSFDHMQVAAMQQEVIMLSTRNANLEEQLEEMRQKYHLLQMKQAFTSEVIIYILYIVYIYRFIN